MVDDDVGARHAAFLTANAARNQRNAARHAELVERAPAIAEHGGGPTPARPAPAMPKPPLNVRLTALSGVSVTELS